MRKNTFLAKTFALSILTAFVVTGFSLFEGSSKYEPRKDHEEFKKLNEKRSLSDAANWLFNIRKDQLTGIVPLDEQIRVRKMAQDMSMAKAGALGLQWENLGPDNVGGRTRCLLIDNRDASGQTLYTGGVCGGLFRSVNGGGTWDLLSDQWENIAVVSICQEPGGRIYVGTGELLLAVRGTPGTGNSSCIGSGIWYSDDGISFSRLSSTDPNPVAQNNTPNDEFAYVYALSYSPTYNKLYAGTNKGLRVSADHGASFSNPTTLTAQPCRDVECSSNGLVIASINNKCYRSDDGANFVLTNLNGSSTPAMSNLEVSIAPSDDNYVYAIGATNGTWTTAGVWRSIDKGVNWTNIYPPSAPAFLNILNEQGDYACSIGVDPFNKDHVICGGLNLYNWQLNSNWTQISAWNYSPFSTLYNHADQHDVIFDKNNQGVIYFVNDGGVFKSSDGGQTHAAMNRNYTTLQLYSVATSVHGEVLGGAQDNGTNLIDYVSGPTSKWADEVMGGDGFDCEFSAINPEASFACLYFGDLQRATNLGGSYASFYSGAPTGLVDNSPFHTVIRLWESFNNQNSLDVVNYVVPAGETITPGETFTVRSGTSFFPFTATNTSATTFNAGDTIFNIKDIVQSRLAVAMGFGTSAKIFLTTRPLDFSSSPYWLPIATATTNATNDGIDGDVSCMSYSKDGDYMFFTTSSGSVYRIKNLNSIRSNTAADTLTGWINNANSIIECQRIGKVGAQVMTSVAVDPNNPNKIIVTCGNYNNTTYVYECSNATTAPKATNMSNFNSIQGNLPKMPVYTSLIDYQDGNKYLLGTEYGIWSSSNGGSSWTYDNSGMANCQVFMLRQQILPYNQCWNSGYIYAGTHGRGFFRTATLAGTKDLTTETKSSINILVYPNPSADFTTIKFTMAQREQANLSIYDLQGKLVKQINWGERPEGNNVITIENDGIGEGTYLACVSTTSGKKLVSKFVIKR